jgi:hypothetical protein
MLAVQRKKAGGNQGERGNFAERIESVDEGVSFGTLMLKHPKIVARQMPYTKLLVSNRKDALALAARKLRYDKPLREWQSNLRLVIEADVCDRSVYWYYDVSLTNLSKLTAEERPAIGIPTTYIALGAHVRCAWRLQWLSDPVRAEPPATRHHGGSLHNISCSFRSLLRGIESITLPQSQKCLCYKRIAGNSLHSY